MCFLLASDKKAQTTENDFYLIKESLITTNKNFVTNDKRLSRSKLKSLLNKLMN